VEQKNRKTQTDSQSVKHVFIIKDKDASNSSNRRHQLNVMVLPPLDFCHHTHAGGAGAEGAGAGGGAGA